MAILPFQRRDSAEFVVTIMASAVGMLFVAVVLLLARLASPPLPPRRDKPVRTSFNEVNEDAGGTHHDRT